MFYFNFPLWNRGINVIFHCQRNQFHIFIRESQVFFYGPEGRESLKKFLLKVLNAVPALVTIVGPLAGHLLLQMLQMTRMNGLCYPCSMHAHCPSDHSLFPWSICHHPNHPLLHTWWWTLGIIWTCLFFLFLSFSWTVFWCAVVCTTRHCTIDGLRASPNDTGNYHLEG